MTITAKIIAHSRHGDAPDLITLQLRYPRFIHAEFMTHRVFSRNASSSRAVPVERMIQDVIDDPAMPVRWGANQPGMQDAGDHRQLVPVPVIDYETNRVFPDFMENQDAWLEARDWTVEFARGFAAAGYHKQVVNRLLEPFGHISVVCTATEWDNFFALRCHPDADPTMRALAEAMRNAIAESVPVEREMHLPYIQPEETHVATDQPDRMWEYLAMISAARCARVSYLNHDGSNPDIEKDLALSDRLWTSKHLSPFEHQAKITGDQGTELWGNLTGWDQHRKMIESSTWG